ncbi:MAG: DUF3616 domain-containing protein [Verrucomicrobia bacterium]|nr:DUF3616 domain-containing protein [Verrucomicrobiota bacterium]
MTNKERITNNKIKLSTIFFLSVVLTFSLSLLETKGVDFVQFSGISDGSAGVVLGSEKTGYKLLIADDEDANLRIYPLCGGKPEKIIPVKGEMPEIKGKKEFDLEGAARVGDTVYWISSHGRNSKGKQQPSRHVFFATRVDDETFSVSVIGKPFQGLLQAITSELAFKEFQLEKSALLEPKKPNGFNIEGLAATPEGTLLIGFRNPIPKGKALLIPLKNPGEVINGAKPVFDKPITLDLGGLGIRDICYSENGYLIVAGPYDKGICKLYFWDGKPEIAPVEVLKSFPSGFSAEIIFYFPEKPNKKWFAVSDDGSKLIGAVENKKLPLSQRTFRGVWEDK